MLLSSIKERLMLMKIRSGIRSLQEKLCVYSHEPFMSWVYTPLHVHCSNLGVPGNFKSTIETIKAAEGLPVYYSYSIS